MEKVALITGTSSGLGRAVSVALGKTGYQLILTGRNKTELEKTRSLIKKAIVIPADLSNLLTINRFIGSVNKLTKRVDVLVNLAGVWHGENEVYANINLEKFEQKVILDTFMVGAIAPTLLVHGLVDLMPKKSKIINISGTFESGAKGWLPYYISNRAIEDLTVGLAQELKRKDIQVNAISPSDCATFAYKKYFPQYINEAISPEKVAQFVVDLCQKNTTGEVFVFKKDKKPFVAFHY